MAQVLCPYCLKLIKEEEPLNIPQLTSYEICESCDKKLDERIKKFDEKGNDRK